MNKKFGHYEVQCELGRGGMGVVYKAWEPSLNRHVAIKVLGEHLLADEAVRERFVREAKSMAALNSPHIIQIYFIGEEEGRPYFAMEYIEGQPLSELLRDDKVLSVEHAREILRQSCKGLGAAHDAGVIHRDIKPANIMITTDGQVKIADFGIARTRELGDKLTSTGEFVGTPGYLSPEVCIGQEVDARADIFSLGIVFYEMLAGGMPFNNDSPLGLMLEVVQAEIPDIRQINKQVDRKTSQILKKMIAKSVDDRYQHCAEIIQDLGPAKSQLNLKTIEAERRAAPAAAKQAKIRTTTPTGEIPTAPALAALTGSHTQLATRPKRSGKGWLAAATLFAVVGAAATGYYTGYLPMPFKGTVDNTSQPAVMLAGDNPSVPAGTSNTTPPASADENSSSPLFNGLMAVMGSEDTGSTDKTSLAINDSSQTQADGDDTESGPDRATVAALPAVNDDPEDAGPQALEIDVATGQNQVSLLPAGPSLDSSQTPQNLQASLNPSDSTPAYETAVKTAPSRRVEIPSLDKMAQTGQPTNPGTKDSKAAGISIKTDTTVASVDTTAAKAALVHAPAAASGHVKTPKTHQAVPLNKGVVVLVFGDPAVANPIEKTIESQLRADNVKVLNEQFIPGFSQLLDKGADLATLRQAIMKNGGQALIIANINPTGTQELEYYGRSSTLNTAQLDVDGYDLRSGETIAGYGNTLSYTALNATEKATEAVMPFMDRLVDQVRQKTGR